MSLYIYAIAEAAPPLEGLIGLEGRGLAAVTEDGLTAVVSELSRRFPEPRDADVRLHDAVIERLMNDEAILPMRFGMVVANEFQLRLMLRRHRALLEERLASVRGAVMVEVEAELEEDPGPGDARHIHDELAGLARESIFRVRERGTTRLEGAYLLDRQAIDGFRARVDELGRERVASNLVCAGPRPPYRFSGAALRP